MKKSIWSIVIVVLVVAVVGSMLGVSLAFADEGKAEVEHSRTVRLAQMSDIHVMIEEWCNPYSQSYASGSIASGKMLGETQELTRTALDDIYAQAIAGDAPMYVFLTGDLTSNGELANTMWVASVLKEYTAKIRAIEGYEGFQFFAIPGNHDIYNQKAGSFMPNPDNADEYAEFWGMSAEQKQAYLDRIAEINQLMATPRVEVGPDDVIVMMSTCTAELDEDRLVVWGKLVPVE